MSRHTVTLLLVASILSSTHTASAGWGIKAPKIRAPKVRKINRPSAPRPQFRAPRFTPPRISPVTPRRIVPSQVRPPRINHQRFSQMAPTRVSNSRRPGPYQRQKMQYMNEHGGQGATVGAFAGGAVGSAYGAPSQGATYGAMGGYAVGAGYGAWYHDHQRNRKRTNHQNGQSTRRSNSNPNERSSNVRRYSHGTFGGQPQSRRTNSYSTKPYRSHSR